MESRAGEDYGFQSGLEGCRPGSVGLPLNIEDVDLVPDMKDLPPAREGWTGMTHFLIHIHLTIAVSKLTVLATSRPPAEDERARVMEEARKAVEGHMQCCNPVIPRQRLALLVATLVLRKVDFLSRVQWQLLQSASFDGNFGSSENLQEAEDILEASHALADDQIMAPHLGPARAYPQYSITLYILWYLCAHPAEFGNQRAWELVQRVLEDERDLAAEGFGAKLTVLEALAATAKAAWENQPKANEPPLSNTGDAPTVTQDESTRHGPYGGGAMGDSQLLFPTQILDSVSGPMQYLEWMGLVSGYSNADAQGDGYWGVSSH